MSQYPPAYPSGPIPYQTPGQQFDPLADLLAPAKRAGVLMIVFGGIAIACGLCFGLVGLAWDEVMRASNPADLANLMQLEVQLGLSVRVMLLIVAGGSLVVGLLFLVLGIVTRGGGAVGIYGSMVVAVIVMGYIGINAIGLLALGGKTPPSTLAGGVCFTVVGLGTMVLLMIWLINAARNIRRIRELKEYQQNYYLYAQQQQAGYPQSPYGQPVWPGYPQQPQPPQQQPPQYPNWPPPPPQA